MYNLWYFVAFYAVLLQKVNFFAIYAVFRKISLLQFTRYCVEKILAQISDRGEKMTNMRYVPFSCFCSKLGIPITIGGFPFSTDYLSRVGQYQMVELLEVLLI